MSSYALSLFWSEWYLSQGHAELSVAAVCSHHMQPPASRFTELIKYWPTGRSFPEKLKHMTNDDGSFWISSQCEDNPSGTLNIKSWATLENANQISRANKINLRVAEATACADAKWRTYSFPFCVHITAPCKLQASRSDHSIFEMFSPLIS